MSGDVSLTDSPREKKGGGKEERAKGRKTYAVYEYVNEGEEEGDEGEEEYQKQSNIYIYVYNPPKKPREFK